MAEYRRLYEEGTERLLAAGITDAKLDARLLLEAVCGTSATTLLAEPERPVEDEEAKQYRAYLLRRAKREPVAYILGSQEFMGLPFQVSREVLIPNQDTEHLVEEAMKDLHAGMHILDLCTGSGCILLSLLHYSLETTGVGTDLSAAALSVAEENAKALGLDGRASWREGDLFEALTEQPKLFDLIVSNPPYIPAPVIPSLEPEVAQQEPYRALCGGEEGLTFYRRIAAEAKPFLKVGGRLLLEIGFDQGETVPAILAAEGWRDIAVIKDYSGHDRVVSCERGFNHVREIRSADTAL